MTVTVMFIMVLGGIGLYRDKCFFMVLSEIRLYKDKCLSWSCEGYVCTKINVYHGLGRVTSVQGEMFFHGLE